MAYRVLARAYRSNTFDEMVGQDAIATTLRNAIAGNRVHHAYLFTGTRGVGKTSMARILAKALNCLSHDGPTATPCLACDSCQRIAAGDDVDVVEIDGASNRGIDEIRSLRGNTALRPARARYKVFIIDEVHMLTREAFNALLKTLEEPPAHVKFIFATTESEKVPATIRSRCQQFDFRTIDVAAILAHLKQVLARENVEAEEAVLRRVARLGNGSMRDALSLLDKLLAYEPKRLTIAIADELLPAPHDELAFALVDAASQKDAAGALAALDRALQTGMTVDRFCDHLIEHLRALMLLHVCGADSELVDLPAQVRAAMVEQAGRYDAPTYVYLISLVEELRRNVKAAGATRALADAAVVRMATCRQFTDIDKLLARVAGGAPAAVPSQPRSAAPAVSATVPAAPRAEAAAPAGEASSGPKASGRDADAAPPSTLPAAERDRVVRDPLVRMVREAVDGTLWDVRRRD